MKGGGGGKQGVGERCRGGDTGEERGRERERIFTRGLKRNQV